jgi:hypothetical protein
VLFIGDAATTKPGNGITPFAQFLDTDTARAAETVVALRELPASWAAPGHGRVIKL